MDSLQQLLEEQIRDLYDAEVQFRAKLPDMIAKATDPDLTEALENISDDTGDTILLIETMCRVLETIPTGITCEAMRGLIREANGTVHGSGDTATIDASLIANAQRIAHYEIAGFGTAREFARCLKLGKAAEILTELTRTAKTHDRTLSQIATGGWFSVGINQEAAACA